MTTAKLCIAVVITALAFSSCNRDGNHDTATAVSEDSAQKAIDTVAILDKFSQSFSIPTDSLALTKHIIGPETEKYLLLAEMSGIREEIGRWNQQIANLQFRFESGMSMMMPTWDADVQDHADASVHINNLLLEYERIVERLIEGDFSGSGAFYEAKTGKSTYWLFESPEGAETKALKRR